MKVGAQHNRATPLGYAAQEGRNVQTPVDSRAAHDRPAGPTHTEKQNKQIGGKPLATPSISWRELDSLPPLLTIAETMRLTGLKRSACYEATRTGHIPIVRISTGRIAVPTYELLKRFHLLEEGGNQSFEGCRYAAFGDHAQEDDQEMAVPRADHDQVCQTGHSERERQDGGCSGQGLDP